MPETEIANETSQREIDIAAKRRFQRDATLFIQAKAILNLVLLVFGSYLPPSPRFASLTGLLIADLVFLVPFGYLVKRGVRAMVIAAYISFAINIITITWLLHLTDALTQPHIILYFLLLPLAGLSISHKKSVWIVSSLVALAWGGMLGLEQIGIAPLTPGNPPRDPRMLMGQIAIIALGFASFAFVVGRAFTAIEEHRTGLTRLLEQTRQEAVWGAVGKRVLMAQNLDDILTVIMQVVNEKMKVESGSVLLRDWGTDDLIFAKNLRGEEEHFTSFRLRLGQGVAGWCAQTGESVIVEDTYQDSRFYSGIDRVTGFTTRSILCVPLIADGETIGVIELLNKLNGPFTQDDLRTLEAIAAQVAVAIQNKRLQGQIHQEPGEPNELFRKVEHAKQEWENTVDAIDEGIALVDDQCRILRANRMLAHWLKTTPAALTGKKCFQVIHGTDMQPATCPHEQLVTRGIAQYSEMDNPILGKTVRLKVYPLKDDQGKLAGSVNVWQDITAEKQLQAQWIHSEKMSATGRLAASLAHEINNPLQAIRGCIDLAQANPESGKTERYLAIANEELERLTTIVRRMLDFYRLENTTRAPTNARRLIEDVLLLSNKRLQYAKIVTDTHWDTEIPIINGVGDQLKQVFLNLLLNAAEAMPQGGRLKIRGEVVDDGNKWLVISISDTGMGVPASDLDKVFEPFYTTKANGTGMGLAVCHNIITTHGGRITIDSAVGHGSTFTVWLPV